MKFLSELERKRPKRTPQHHFQSETMALKHLKEFGIEPNGKSFVVIAERHYGNKTFDALDHLMFSHHYQVHFI